MENPLTVKIYAEWAYYETEEEKKEAEQYLLLWKKFYLRRLGKNVKHLEDHFIDRKPWEVGVLSRYGTLAIKMCVTDPLNREYEL